MIVLAWNQKLRLFLEESTLCNVQIRVSLSGVGCGVLGALAGVGANKEPPPHSGASCGKTKLLFGFKGSIDSLTASNSLERDRDTTDGAFVGVGAISRLTLSPVSIRIFFAGGWDWCVQQWLASWHRRGTITAQRLGYTCHSKWWGRALNRSWLWRDRQHLCHATTTLIKVWCAQIPENQWREKTFSKLRFQFACTLQLEFKIKWLCWTVALRNCWLYWTATLLKV